MSLGARLHSTCPLCVLSDCPLCSLAWLGGALDGTPLRGCSACEGQPMLSQAGLEPWSGYTTSTCSLQQHLAMLYRCQEEPMNMGAYFHVAPRLKTCFNENNRSSPHQVRPASASRAYLSGTGRAAACLMWEAA